MAIRTPRSISPLAPGLAGLMAALAMGCGGGGSGVVDEAESGNGGAAPPVPSAPLACTPPPEGLQPATTHHAAVGGTIVGRRNPSFVMLQMPGNDGYGFDRALVYGPDLAASPSLSGIVWASSGVGCSSVDTRARNGGDRDVDGGVYLLTDVDTAAQVPRLTSGSLRYLRPPGETYTLQATGLPGMVPDHVPASMPVADLAGRWSLLDIDAQGVQLDAAADGAIRIEHRGCALGGRLSVAGGGLIRIEARRDPGSCPQHWAQDLPYVGGLVAYPRVLGGWQMIVVLSTNNGVDSDNVVAAGGPTSRALSAVPLRTGSSAAPSAARSPARR